MPELLHTPRRRYFTSRKLADTAPEPTDRLLFLELLEVDTVDGVARFSYELADPASELWVGRSVGFESRASVRAEARQAALGGIVDGGQLEIPLSDDPQVTQLEVRFADPAAVTVYRVITRGSDARTFHYREEGDPTERVDAEKLDWRYEFGELRGYDLGEVQSNGQWRFESGATVFEVPD